MEDYWDLPDTNPPINPSAITPETARTENWDGDFAVEIRNNSQICPVRERATYGRRAG